MANHSVINKDKFLSTFINNAGLIVIGIFSLGYCLFGSRIAELHVSFVFLRFPIFIGEILLFLCFILFILKWRIEKLQFNYRHYLLFCYSLFILIKAGIGYYRWCPLAFRHSALFYYPLFAVFGYYFYQKDLFNNRIILFLALLVASIFTFLPFSEYFLTTFVILFVILAKSYSFKVGRYFLFLLLLIVVPYKNFFHTTTRTLLISNIVVGIYIIITVFSILRIKNIYKFIIPGIFIFLMLMSIFKMSNSKVIQSFTNIGNLISQYNKYDKIITEKKDYFRMQELKVVRLYNPEERNFKKSHISINTANTAETQDNIQDIINRKFNVSYHSSEEPIKQEEIVKQEIPEPETSVKAYAANALFRLFIWRDVLMQIKEERPLLGVDFGKPFRSVSLEILGWAEGAWQKDGWVSIHNSYLDILYRSGIMGILFIGIICYTVANNIKKSINIRSLNGILLCGILIFWLVAANFGEIFELPYYAIPFWSLFGVVLAYISNLSIKK